MNLGDTFFWSPDGNREHLYVIVTDPKKNDGRFAVFNFTRSRGGTKALTFKIGDHPFLSRYASDVNLGDGLIISLSTIEVEILTRRATVHQPMPMDQIERIVKFAVGHPAVPGEIERLIKAQWNLI